MALALWFRLDSLCECWRSTGGGTRERKFKAVGVGYCGVIEDRWGPPYPICRNVVIRGFSATIDLDRLPLSSNVLQIGCYITQTLIVGRREFCGPRQACADKLWRT